MAVTGGTQTDTVTIGDSNLLPVGYLTSQHMQYHWDSVCSLAPGRYSGEVQMQVFPGSSNAASQWAMDANDFMFLTVIEGMPGVN